MPDRPHRAFLALGSNIDPERNLPEAVRRLARHGKPLAVSRVYQTRAVGRADQPDFLNAAVLLETPAALLDWRARIIPEIEAALGRVRVPGDKNAPRTIDVDLALFDREVVEAEGWRLPDPDILARPFLAVPLAELDPGHVHPEDGRTLAEIAATFGQPETAMRLRPDVRLW